eukprot:403344229
MYKQCIELLTAQGTNTQKTFSIIQGSHQGEAKKDFDSSIKGNVYYLEGHKIIMPAISNNENMGGGGGSKTSQIQNLSQTGKLDIIHRYLVIQMFLAPGDPFSCELHIKDKHNNRRRLMLVEGSKDIVCNSMHARIPNGLIKKNIWLNLCIDIQSFVNECFGKAQQTASNPIQSASNFYKCLEQIQIEGHLRIRKVFSSRSQIPCEFGDLNNQQIITGSGTVQELAEVEFLPKSLDFNQSVNSNNQLLNYDQVQQYLMMNSQNGVEESIMITGLQIQNKTQSNMKDKKLIGTQKKKLSQDNYSMKNQQLQQEQKSLSEVQGLSTGSSFRPNKFGQNNKTQDSFQQQKSNASTANQTSQNNTVYSMRTNSSKKQFGGLSHQNSGLQSSQSPFQKGSNSIILQKKRSNNQIDDVYEDGGSGPQIQRVSMGSSNKTGGQKDKNSSVPPQQRGQYSSQNRKSPGPDQMIGQHRYNTKTSGINNTRNTKAGLNLTGQNSNNQSHLITINGSVNQSNLNTMNLTPKQEYNKSAQNTFTGFQQIHQTTIVEENETVAPSERVSHAVNEYHIHQLNLQRNEESKFSSKNGHQSDSDSRFQTKGPQKSKQQQHQQKNKSQIRSNINKDNAYGLSSLGIEKQKTDSTNNAYQNNIEDSIGIVGSSINKNNKAAAVKGIQNTVNRNQNQQQKRISQSNINSAAKTKNQKSKFSDQQKGPIVRKFSTGEDYNEEETFKNKTLRFTNNNFAATNQQKRENTGLQTTVNGWHHTKDQNTLLEGANNANSDGEESIEEEIMTQSLNDTPVLGGRNRKHAKAQNLNKQMPPLAPRTKLSDSSTSKLKFTPIRGGQKQNEQNQDDNLRNPVEDNIEEDIRDHISNDDTQDNDDYELFQAPINGGVPIRLIYQIDNSTSQKRPFTPPFQQIVKMQQLGINGINSKLSTQRKDELLQQTYVIKNPIEEEIDQQFNIIPDRQNKTTNNSNHGSEDPILRDSLERDSSSQFSAQTPIPNKLQNPSQNSNSQTSHTTNISSQNININNNDPQNKKKQLIYDTQLKCYYDPETNEYFELKTGFSMQQI